MLGLRRLVPVLGVSLSLVASGELAAQTDAGTAFTYQGRISLSGSPYNGTCDFTFTLWDALGSGSPPVGGTQIGGSATATALPVAGGLFTVPIDFGADKLNGDARWLQVKVGCPTATSQTFLAPRQELKPALYALALPGLRTQQNGADVPNLLGGYSGNTVTAGVHAAVLAGGGELGNENNVHDHFAVISGGRANKAGSSDGDPATSMFATVGGGNFNRATGPYSVVSGGDANQATGEGSTVPGGDFNLASGLDSFAAGYSSTASGAASFAAGSQAQANHPGSFVWADTSSTTFASGADNQFKARATGGVKFVVGTGGWACTATDGNTWSCTSDRSQKENFEMMDPLDVLDRVSKLPVLKWNGKGTDPNVKHAGPMAQDFYAAFGLGNDDKMISTIDLDGVALAAIQGLNEKERNAEAEIESLKARNAELEERLRALECALAAR